MPQAVNGFSDNPASLLESVFQSVAETSMQALPFYRPQIPVRACGFQLYEGQWIGCLLTPWMLSLLVLPGPDQTWTRRTVGEKLALSLPCGNVRFTVGETAGCGQYLASSLISPLNSHAVAEQMILLAEQTARMALSLPVVDASRRALFRMSTDHA